jgi:hypothetical protein
MRRKIYDRRMSTCVGGAVIGTAATPLFGRQPHRAGASIDRKHDKEDLKPKIPCPVLALWGKQGAMQRYFDVLSIWRERAVNVSGNPVAGRRFLAGRGSRRSAVRTAVIAEVWSRKKALFGSPPSFWRGNSLDDAALPVPSLKFETGKVYQALSRSPASASDRQQTP